MKKDDFAEWIYEQDCNGNLPILGEKRTAVGLEILTKGYQLYADANTARYQIQMRLIYEED